MKLIPPFTGSEKCDNTSLRSVRARISELDKATNSSSALFQRQIISPNSFGANEVWAHYTNEVEAQSQFFFPDVGIFSKKLRLVDLFRKRNFACYSEFMYDNARLFLDSTRFRFAQTPTKVRHPYVLIETLWQREHLINDFAPFSDSALLFLPKSTDAVERSLVASDLLKAINECKQHANRVSLCIYFRDLERYSYLNDIDGVSTVSCGLRFDALFYFRLNLLITSHKFVAFFEPGSHSIFAAVSDKPVLYIPRKVQRVVKDAYQLTRYPKQEELEDFDNVTQHLLASNSAPRQAVQYKKFLNYGLDTCIPHLDRPASKFPKLTYPLYKLAKMAITKADRQIRKELKE